MPHDDMSMWTATFLLSQILDWIDQSFAWMYPSICKRNVCTRTHIHTHLCVYICDHNIGLTFLWTYFLLLPYRATHCSFPLLYENSLLPLNSVPRFLPGFLVLFWCQLKAYGFVITSYDWNVAGFSSLSSEAFRMLPVTLRFLIQTGAEWLLLLTMKQKRQPGVPLAGWAQILPKTSKCCLTSKRTTSGLLLSPVAFSESSVLELWWLGSVPGQKPGQSWLPGPEASMRSSLPWQWIWVGTSLPSPHDSISQADWPVAEFSEPFDLLTLLNVLEDMMWAVPSPSTPLA